MKSVSLLRILTAVTVMLSRSTILLRALLLALHLRLLLPIRDGMLEAAIFGIDFDAKE